MSSGYSTGMDIALILANIDRLLKAKGMSQNEASQLAGRPEAIRNLRRKVAKGSTGKGSMRADTLEALAKFLGTTSDELQRPYTAAPPVSGMRDILAERLTLLDRERSLITQQLADIDRAELTAQKRPRRKMR